MMKKILCTCCLILLTACSGWHKRGTVASIGSNDFTIIEQNDDFSLFQRELTKMMQTDDSPDADDSDNLDLYLLKEHFNSAPSVIGRDSQVKYHRLTYSITFKVLTRDGQTIIPETTLSSSQLVASQDKSPQGATLLNEEAKQALRSAAAHKLSLRLSIANDSQHENSNTSAP